MKILFMILIMICFPLNVFASNIKMEITKAESEIQESSKKSIKCDSEITLDSELLGDAVYAASEKRKEYKTLENCKKIETNVIIDVKASDNKITLNIPSNIKDYSLLADNIIMNINGMYCYIKLNELTGSQDLKISINDSQNIIADYNGSAAINFVKLISLILSCFVVVYIIGFMFFILKKNDINGKISKKKIYISVIMTLVVCILYGGALYSADLSSFAVEKAINISDTNNPTFEVTFDKNESIDGVYLGLPLYGEGFTPDYTAVWLKADDSSQSDKIIGGNYNDVLQIIKFPVRTGGNYYLKNNKREFDDINESNKDLYKAVSVLASKNILNGKTEGIYGVDDTVTRGEAVTMFSKLLNLGSGENNDADFDDVSNSDWYFSYVARGKENNILKGYDDNTFRAESAITRQEFVSVLGQIMENRLGYVVSEDYSNLAVYTDNKEISLWAKKYVSLLEKENMNIWDKVYEPKKAITRSEAAILLYRCYILIK